MQNICICPYIHIFYSKEHSLAREKTEKLLKYCQPKFNYCELLLIVANCQNKCKGCKNDMSIYKSYRRLYNNVNGLCIFHIRKGAWFKLVVYTLYVVPILTKSEKAGLRQSIRLFLKVGQKMGCVLITRGSIKT